MSLRGPKPEKPWRELAPDRSKEQGQRNRTRAGRVGRGEQAHSTIALGDHEKPLDSDLIIE